jgi:hypothetical protein
MIERIIEVGMGAILGCLLRFHKSCIEDENAQTVVAGRAA